MAQDIFFQGIASPARIVGAGDLVAELPVVAVGWSLSVAVIDPVLTPFFTISAEVGSEKLACQSRFQPGKTRRLDKLNAICDLMAALALALPEADAQLICLHAAAVKVAGQVLIFPNTRRAGKSTLSVALALAGEQVIGDDVVPLGFDSDGRAHAHGMGISPRLRLPLPSTVTPEFRAGVASAGGMKNAQYHYIRLPDQPAQGARFPVGAFVILDRQDDPVPARIEKVSPDRAMDVLLYQNFTRDRHSGDVLRGVAGMLRARPVFRLTYSDLEGAVRCLQSTFANAPEPLDVPLSLTPFRLADLAPYPRCRITPAERLRARPGTERQVIGDRLYLADVRGQAIHRLDPLAMLIWDLLADPATPEELEALLAEAFPDADTGQIAADLGKLLRKWAKAGLTEAAG